MNVSPADLPSAAAGSDRGSEDQALAAFQQGRQHIRQLEPEKAADEFRRAIRLDPGLAEAQFALGKVLVYFSDVVVGTRTRDLQVLEEGIAVLKQASVSMPESAKCAYWTGYALSLRGKNEEAVEYLSKALELDPTHGLAHKELALIHAQAGEAELAKEHLGEAIRCLPNDADVWLQYGMQLEADEDLRGAREAYERSVGLNRAVPSPHARLAAVLQRLGDRAGAAQAAREFEAWSEHGRQLNERLRLANARPDDSQALLEVGQTYCSAGQYDLALGWIHRSLDVDPSNWAAHLTCSIIAREQGQYPLATEHLEKAAHLAPDSLEPRLELIRLVARMDDQARIDDVVASFEAQVDPGDVEAHLALAAVLFEVGRKAAASARYRAILEIEPDNQEAQAALRHATDEGGE